MPPKKTILYSAVYDFLKTNETATFFKNDKY